MGDKLNSDASDTNPNVTELDLAKEIYKHNQSVSIEKLVPMGKRTLMIALNRIQFKNKK